MSLLVDLLINNGLPPAAYSDISGKTEQVVNAFDKYYSFLQLYYKQTLMFFQTRPYIEIKAISFIKATDIRTSNLALEWGIYASNPLLIKQVDESVNKVLVRIPKRLVFIKLAS